ncbi:MAG: YcbK family protein [Aeromonas veronii]
MKYNRFFDSKGSDKKLECSCGCGFGSKPGDVDEAVILIVTCARIHFGKPVIITSGPRCVLYNAHKDVQGAANSYHLPKDKNGVVVASGGVCHAIDFYVKGVPVRELYDWLCATFPGRYGIGDGCKRGFVHVDTRKKGIRFNY